MKGFGHTWWGRAWLDALTGPAGIDGARLERGRSYATDDRVEQLEIGPGDAFASVRGSHRLRYRTHLLLRTHSESAWEELAAVAASSAGRIASVLSGDLDQGLSTDAASIGLDLLPGPGDIDSSCSCPDRSPLCKHAAAIALLVAEAIDDDPFVLLDLRGRTRSQFLADVRAIWDQQRSVDHDADEAALERLASAGPEGTGPDPGEVARDAWARVRRPLPDLPEVPAEPSAPVALPGDPPPTAPFDTPGLIALATDAAARAHAQLAGSGDSGLAADAATDIARRSGGGATTAGVGNQSIGAGRDAAWRHGGAEGLEAMAEEPWQPPAAAMAVGRDAVAGSGVPPGVTTITDNRITIPGFQLRYSRSGTWWRYEKRAGDWEIAMAPSADPTDLLGPSTQAGPSA